MQIKKIKVYIVNSQHTKHIKHNNIKLMLILNDNSFKITEQKSHTS